MQTAFHASTEEILIRLLLQISVILLAARVGGCLFKRWGQSQPIGEIFAGVLLGPSVFGWLFPGAFHMLFPSEGPQIIPFFSHIGLILTLFLIGMEFDYGEVPKYGKQVAGVASATLLFPLVTGAGLAVMLWRIAPGSRTFLAYSLFIGLTLAITAIPIMGRILMDLKLTKTRVGLLGITAGAVKDLFTWFLLALVIGLASPPVDFWKVIRMLLLTGGLAAFVLTIGRRILDWAERAYPVKQGRPNPNLLSGLLITLLLLSAATSKIGIFAIFGAFLAGVFISHRRELSEAVSERLHDLTVLFFLPIFFTYTGLRADLTELQGWLWIGMLLIVTLGGTLSNAGPAYLVARRSGLSSKESLSLAALINTPGLMVLIILNIGLDLKVVPLTIFSLLMANALIRDLFTTPILRRCARELPLLSVRESIPWPSGESVMTEPRVAAVSPSRADASPEALQD